jgi:hypothetical protein
VESFRYSQGSLGQPDLVPGAPYCLCEFREPDEGLIINNMGLAKSEVHMDIPNTVDVFKRSFNCSNTRRAVQASHGEFDPDEPISVVCNPRR